ncbi:MAG: hypothetical protein AAGF11_52655 [Myxococcota bacterium]
MSEASAATMLPYFNIAGPCIRGQHYMLPPQRRLREVLELIESHRYFTLHAGRQTGKTTSAMWLEDHLNATGRYRAAWVDLQTAREKPDVASLMTDWQEFWREDGHLAAEGFRYREAGPHLMLMAFLQRVINGGGRIVREYGLGRGALDLLVEWSGRRHAIEVKIRRDMVTEQRALEQITRYLDHAGLDEGWLVMFDLRSTLSWDERLTIREVEHHGKRVHIVGC